ncbi:MAG: CBS domain-containing protein [Acidimicrobiia bacterium]
MATSTPVTDVMTRDVITLSPDQSLAEAADVLTEHGIGAAPVVDAGGSIVGLLRDEDLLISEARLHLPTTIAILPGIEFTLPGQIRRYDEELKKAASSTVADVMEREFKRVDTTATVEDVATMMHEHDVTHIPVVVDGKVAGIVARGDIVRFLAATT